MTARYAVSDGQTIGRIIPRPNGFNGAVFGSGTQDDKFRNHGLWPVKVNDPGPGAYERESGRTHEFSEDGLFVIETVQYELIPVDERKPQMREDALQQFEASLQRGFSYDGGTFPATGPKRQRVVEHASRINAYSNGDASAALPNGKSTLRFVDLEGEQHDFDAQQVIALAETGDDLADGAETRLEELYDEIKSAESHDDLDAIKVDEGWPN